MSRRNTTIIGTPRGGTNPQPPLDCQNIGGKMPELTQWEGCYDDGWQGDIIPEAFSHPAKFSRGLIHRIYQHAKEMGWVHPRDYVLDPFGGIALGALDALSMGLNWIGIELEEKFVSLGQQNIVLWNRQLKGWPNLGTARIVQGNSRQLGCILKGYGSDSKSRDMRKPLPLIVSSPPYSDCGHVLEIKFSRFWAMPTKNTFDCPPIGNFVKKYLKNSRISIDPFARNKQWATYTNDINPSTKADYHMDSVDFLKMLETRGVKADLAIVDPPYSPEQMKRAYNSFGLSMNGRDALRTAGWKAEKDIISRILDLEGFVLCFGWDSNGMGKSRNFQLEEIMIVCHGAGHNDTICIAERKRKSWTQIEAF